MNLLTIKNFSKSYTDKILFDNADFSINSKEKIGIIGVNGTGKSTLLKIEDNRRYRYLRLRAVLKR